VSRFGALKTKLCFVSENVAFFLSVYVLNTKNFIYLCIDSKIIRMDSKKKRNRERMNNFCKVAIDVGKLAFASMVLGSIINSEIEKAYLIVSGLTASLLLIIMGVLLTQPNEED